MKEAENTSGAVGFLYGTVPGRLLLKGLLATRADRLAVAFLRSRASRWVVPLYARRHGVDLSPWGKEGFASFQDFFRRTGGETLFDPAPERLISPCDGWLSAYPLRADSSFAIKQSHYRLADLLQDEALARRYAGGDCLIFRLCPSDYHHYCYIDSGYQGENHPIPGQLHSVQPIACETYPVYVLNRRCWTLLETEHFGPVVQTEIGALVVGGICNPWENRFFRKGEEKGCFELSGSTIVLLLERDRVRLRPELQLRLAQGEVRVRQGMWIGSQCPGEEGTA